MRRFVLLAADGCPAGEIAQRMHTSRPTVLLWKKRFDERGPCGSSRTRQRDRAPIRLDDATTRAILETTGVVAPTGGDHWTTRALAKVLGVSNATVARVWKAHSVHTQKKEGPETTGTWARGTEEFHLAWNLRVPPLKGVCGFHRNTDPPRPTDTDERLK